MLYKSVFNQKQKIVKSHIFFLVAPTLALITLIYFYPNQLLTWTMGYVSFSMLFTISLLIKIGRLKKTLVGLNVYVISSENQIPFPQKFRDRLAGVSEFTKYYRYKKHQIPSSFVEFKEGHTVYLYQKIEKPSGNETYRILEVHDFQYVLVEDCNNKKKIVHLGNLTAASVG
ncbi:MAG: hypothetical protein Q7I99_05215 [Acholeplasmataceae bacterium]|nr:hypothetical protein [Acholeplasmataceae bacterium]